MQDNTNQHPFERLPTHLRQSPPVVDAWLIDLSRQSRNDTHRPQDEKPSALKNENIRLMILGLMFLTTIGVIKPEVLIKLLPILFRLVVGVTA